MRLMRIRPERFADIFAGQHCRQRSMPSFPIASIAFATGRKDYCVLFTTTQTLDRDRTVELIFRTLKQRKKVDICLSYASGAMLGRL